VNRAPHRAAARKRRRFAVDQGQQDRQRVFQADGGELGGDRADLRGAGARVGQGSL
jgi:hypothetical protein